MCACAVGVHLNGIDVLKVFARLGAMWCVGVGGRVGGWGGGGGVCLTHPFTPLNPSGRCARWRWRRWSAPGAATAPP